MNNTPLRDVYQIVTNRIIEQLEQGVIPWRQSWTEAGLPQNLITRKPYRGINTMLLASYNYERNFFLTFRQAQELGAMVKKGEQSHLIVFWKWIEQPPDETGTIKKIPFLRYYTVFNISQCEGIPGDIVPEIQEREHKPLKACDLIIEAMPMKPVIEHKEHRAFYNPFRDYVNMPKKHTFESAEEYYTTLFHELVHSTGHKSRLNRKSLVEMAEFGSDRYSFEELIAETGACYLASAVGIGLTVFENSVAYIESWLKVFKDDKKFVVQASAHAQRAVDFILNLKSSCHEEKEEPVAEPIFF